MVGHQATLLAVHQQNYKHFFRFFNAFQKAEKEQKEQKDKRQFVFVMPSLHSS
jgi:hypothetical protein